MGQQWYCNIGDRVSGPFSARDLKRLVAEGRLGPHHHIGKSVTGPWFQAGEVRGVFSHRVVGGSAAAASSQPPDAPVPQPSTQSVGAPAAPQPPGGGVPGIAAGPPRVEAGTRIGRRGRIESPRERRRREQKTLIIGSAVATFAGVVLLVVLLITNPFAASPASQKKPTPKPEPDADAVGSDSVGPSTSDTPDTSSTPDTPSTAATTDAEVDNGAAEEDAVDAELRKAIGLQPERQPAAKATERAKTGGSPAKATDRTGRGGVRTDADTPESPRATDAPIGQRDVDDVWERSDEPVIHRPGSSSAAEATGDRPSSNRKTSASDREKPIDSRELLRREYPGLFED